jgi:hypothetical protein
MRIDMAPSIPRIPSENANAIVDSDSIEEPDSIAGGDIIPDASAHSDPGADALAAVTANA